MLAKLHSRDDFRSLCLKRDQNRCVFCGATEGLAVHHIIERRLFPDGGYYLENGATVCEPCHLDCEMTLHSVEDVRAKVGIPESRKVLPPHLYDDQVYDKWGNPVMSDQTRLRGELFYDESVQKILAQGGKLDLFAKTHYVKYPRTYHLPWSEGMHDDDRMLPSLEGFIGQRVIVTEKMDGENTSMYSDHIHARSLDSGPHPSRAYVKGMWAQFMGDIPEGWRVCGENLYAKHSIHYTDLPSYLLGFSIWNERNVCLSWDETLEWFQLLGITPVPVLYDGIWDEKKIRSLWDSKKWSTSEGYVVRVSDSFPFADFKRKVAKMVRKGHVQTATHHWMAQQVIPNKLAGKS